MNHSHRQGRALLAALVGVCGLMSSAAIVFGQVTGPVAPGPVERVALLPFLGDPGARAKSVPRDQLVRVQNAGSRSTRVLLVASYAPRPEQETRPRRAIARPARRR